jgi:uncharacterized protein
MDLTKEAGPLILYQLGLSYGLEVGTQGKDIVKGPTTMTIRFLENYGLLAGWGRFESPELENDEKPLTTKPVTVRLYNNFFAHASESTTGNPSCFFVSGVIAGVLNGILGGHYNCLESQCVAAGSKYCEFVVTPNQSL